MSKELLEKCRAEAEREGRSLSNWLEQLVKKSLILALLAGAAWHFLPAPRPAIREAGSIIATAAKSAAAYVAKL